MGALSGLSVPPASAGGRVDPLKVEVVIPDGAKDRTELSRLAWSARKTQNYPFALGFCFEIESYPLPIVRPRWQRLRTRQSSIVRGIENRDHRHAGAVQILSADVAFKTISGGWFYGDSL